MLQYVRVGYGSFWTVGISVVLGSIGAVKLDVGASSSPSLSTAVAFASGRSGASWFVFGAIPAWEEGKEAKTSGVAERVAYLAREKFGRAAYAAEEGGVLLREKQDSQLRPCAEVVCGGVGEYIEAGRGDASACLIVNKFHCHGFDHFLDGAEGCGAHEFAFEGGVMGL